MYLYANIVVYINMTSISTNYVTQYFVFSFQTECVSVLRAPATFIKESEKRFW